MTKIAHHHRVPQTVHLTAQQTSWLLPPRPSPALDELHRRANPYYNAPAKSHRPQPADFSLLSPPTDIRLTAFVSDIDAGRRSSYAYVVAPATKPETFTTAKPLPNRLKAEHVLPTPPETPTSPTASQILDHPTPPMPGNPPFSPCKTVKTPSSVLLRASTNPNLREQGPSIRFASTPVLEAPLKMSYAEALRSSTSTAVASGRPSMLTRNI
ncbi:hypothetical protein BC829DRAFT_397730 [Chytridium lagenaria]|nr:hypothetical protein BC829DRAFT_397730 [Chytridium lagenaria]